MSNVTARYVDTCLPDYLQDSYSRDGQALCLSPLGCSLEDTVESLFDSYSWDDSMPESIGDHEIRDALREALAGVDLRYIDEEGNRQDEPDDDRDGDEPYIYVVVEWDASVVKLRLTVDVEYFANGTDPHDLKTVLENLISFAVSDGSLCGGTDAEVKSWGATAEPVK